MPDGTRAHFNGIFQRHYPMGEDGTGKPLTQLMQEWVRAGNLDDTTSDLYKEIQSRYEKMHMIDLNLNDVVEVVINNHDEGQHPLHVSPPVVALGTRLAMSKPPLTRACR